MGKIDIAGGWEDDPQNDYEVNFREGPRFLEPVEQNVPITRIKIVECIATTLEIKLVPGPYATFGYPRWRCPVDCIKRPGGSGGEVRVELGNAPKRWGRNEVIHGVVRCRRVEDNT